MAEGAETAHVRRTERGAQTAGPQGEPTEWAAGLCACWTAFPGVCCLSYPFYCLGLARVWHRARLGSYASVVALTAGLFAALVLINVASVAITFRSNSAQLMDQLRDDDETLDDKDIVLVEPYSVVVLRWVAYLVAVAQWGLLMYTRLKLVERYKLREHPAVSCLATTLCGTCSLGQQMMHVDMMEQGLVDTDCSCDADHPRALLATQMQ